MAYDDSPPFAADGYTNLTLEQAVDDQRCNDRCDRKDNKGTFHIHSFLVWGRRHIDACRAIDILHRIHEFDKGLS